MKVFDRWIYRKLRDMWDNKSQYDHYLEEADYKQRISTKMSGAQMAVPSSLSVEGQDAIRFELSTAVGGRILQVRRYNERTDSSNNQTYVIPSGEDVGERVAKIINLELLK